MTVSLFIIEYPPEAQSTQSALSATDTPRSGDRPNAPGLNIAVDGVI